MKVLYSYENLSIRDISGVLNIPVGTVIDNSERLVSSHDPEDDTITGSSSYYFENTNDRILLTGTYQFPTPVPIAQVSGVYLEDYYLSFKE